MFAQCFVVSVFLTLCPGNTSSPTVGPGNASDEQLVKSVIDKLTIAWNEKNAETLAGFYSEDADYVNSRGKKLVGRESIKRWLEERFKQDTYRNSRHKRLNVSVRFLSSDIAIADSEWEITGLVSEAGESLPSRKGNSIMILVRSEQKWLIVALRSMVPVNE